jgi:hypothetical protein
MPGVFGENSSVTICGSDHGSIYIFRTSSPECVQQLWHNKGEVCTHLELPNLDVNEQETS